MKTSFSQHMFLNYRKSFCTFTMAALVLGVIGCVGPIHRVPTGSSEAVQAEREKQLKMVLEKYLKRYDRLLKVSFPILTGSTGRCGVKHKYDYGLNLHHRDDYPEEFRPILGSLGIGDEVTVRYVHPDGPAAKAGLQAGDRLLAINSKSVEGKNTEGALKILAEFFRESGYKFSFFRPPPPLPVGVMRQGQELEFSIPGVKSCGFEIVLVISDSVNAFADGNHIVLTTGMLRFAEADEDLALVMGHELAHNTLGHIEKKKMNAAPGQILDDWIFQGLPIFGNLTAQAFAQEFELEADYAGLYYTARGGYDITEAAQFWRQMATEHPGGIEDNFLSTHPSAPERFIALEEAVKEIDEKRRKGLVLTPELMDFKKGPVTEEPQLEEES